MELVFHQEFERIEDAAAAERQIKGWRRAKKEALIDGRYESLRDLLRVAAQPGSGPHPSILRDAVRWTAPQDEKSVEWPHAERL